MRLHAVFIVEGRPSPTLEEVLRLMPADEPLIYRARATRWDGGWELHVEGVGVTQVSSLDDAERAVRAYIGTTMGVDTSGAEIAIEKAVDPLTEDAAASMDEDERPSR